MTTFLRTFPLNRLAAVTAALGLLAASPLRTAEQNANYEIHFGVKAGVDLGASFKLRPTVQQPLYVWVLNNSDKDAEDVTVEVLADGAPVDGTVQHVAVKAKSKTQVVFGKPLAAAAPPPAPPAVPAPPAKPQPPALQEAKGALQVAVLDAAGKEKLVTADLPLARPEDYVQVTDISYNPEAKGGDPKNTLTVKVKALGGFGGPASRVDLVLRPDRIPGLIDSPHKEGTRTGFIGPDGTLTLKAADLQFEEGVRKTNGLVYLTIDGWERAYTYYTTFPTDGGQAGQPQAIRNIPVVRMIIPAVANPGAPLPVALEVDMNGPVAGKQVALGFDRDNDGTYSADSDELATFPGDRQVRILVGVADGALLLQPQVQDWKKDWDASNVFGPRTLQVQVLNKGGLAVDLYNSEDATGAATFEQWMTKTEIQKTVLLDAAPPEGIHLAFPAKLKRGADLPVQATSSDKPSEIKEVFFYVGRPGPDGAPPATALKVKGTWDETHKLWAAVLPAPTDQKGKVDVTATFVKFTNVPANSTVTVQLEDAASAAAAAPKGGSIAGTVVEGGRGQPGLEVRLLDDKGAVKDAVKTDAKGAYIFKEVVAGSYRVASTKTVDSTKGETAALVLDGKNQVGVDINLQR